MKNKNFQFIYDGDCPICNHFACELGQSQDKLDLTDARGAPELIEQMKSNGVNIDDGTVVFVDGRMLYGVEAVIYLANNLQPSGFLSSIFISLFRYRLFARFFYPLLVLLRKLLLMILGKPLINWTQTDDELKKLNEIQSQEPIIKTYYNSACPVCDAGVQRFKPMIEAVSVSWIDVHSEPGELKN